MKIARRTFVGLVAGAAAGAVAGLPSGSALSNLFATADSPYQPPGGPEAFHLSVCALCPGGCGVRVRTIGGRPVKIDGNPRHPISGGRLCPKGQAGLQSLYHPDRVATPLRRKGARGSLSSFEKKSWKEALNEIGGRLRMIRSDGKPESAVLLRSGGSNLGNRVASRFMAAFGSPNDIRLDRGDEAASIALRLTQGIDGVPVADLAATDYVLSLGSAVLEASSSPVASARAFGEFRQVRTGRRGKLVQVEPRMSMTAAAADEWIPIRPGTEGIFGLGVAAALVNEELFNRVFLADRIAGFESSGAGESGKGIGLRALLERDYGLERVAAETGAPVNVILRVARELAAARSSLVLGPRRGPLLSGSLFDHLAAQTLNALLGNIDSPGGILVAEETPLAKWPALPSSGPGVAGRMRERLDRGGRAGSTLASSDPERLAESILAGSPYAAEILFLLDADPLVTSAAPALFAQALEKVPLVVAVSPFANDSALHADWILPEAHFLERWDLHTTPAGVAYPLASLAKPVIEKPQADVRSAAEIFLGLAQAVGDDVPSSYPATEVAALIRYEMDGLFASRRGAVMGTEFDEGWVRMMEGAGWWAPGYKTADELWEKAQEAGGWWDPFYDHEDWSRVLKTRSGKFDLPTALLEEAGGERARLRASARIHVSDRGSEDLPALVVFEPLAIAGGFGAELPFLPPLLDPGLEERWETWAEVHPATAAVFGMSDRSWVRVSAGESSIVVRLRITNRVTEHAVAIPAGLGRKAAGRWASGLGANPFLLVAGARDPLSGLPEPELVRVRLESATGPEPLGTAQEGLVGASTLISVRDLLGLGKMGS